MGFFHSLLNAKSDILDPDIPKGLPQQPVASALKVEPTKEEIATVMKAMADAKAVGLDSLPVELLKLRLQQDRTILLELHPYLVRGESFTAVERRGHHRTPQEGR